MPLPRTSLVIQDEEIALSQQLQQQKALLERAGAAHQRCAQRLRELSSTAQDGSAARLIELQTEEVNNLRFQARAAGLGVGPEWPGCSLAPGDVTQLQVCPAVVLVTSICHRNRHIHMSP